MTFNEIFAAVMTLETSDLVIMRSRMKRELHRRLACAGRGENWHSRQDPKESASNPPV